jgi:hypothetical protein
MHSVAAIRLATVAFLLAAPVAAQATAVAPSLNPQPGDIHTMLTSGGLENPEVIFAFNPQPDPPGKQTYLDLTNPEVPTLLLPAVNQTYELVIGFPYGGFAFGTPTGLTTTNLATTFSFNATAADGAAYLVDVTILGYMGGFTSFNPQPDPPGDIGFQFTADPQASIQIFQIEGQDNVPLSFTEVPEPASLAILALGTAALAARRRRPRRGAAKTQYPVR